MIEIKFLKECPEVIPLLAAIWHEGLGQHWIPDVSITNVIAKFKQHVNEDCLPLTLVAFKDGQAIGMASLRVNDGIRPDLTPWLGSLVVHSAYQKQGVGERLIKAIKQQARYLKFERLYLFAFDPNLPAYYEKHHWTIIGVDQFKDKPVTVMETHLS